MQLREYAERLGEIFEAAEAFGLTDEEVCEVFVEVGERTPPNRPAIECLGELSEALARRILELPTRAE